MNHANTKSDFLQKLSALDLQPIKYSLVKMKDGPKWPIAKADAIEKWYKRFLILNFLYPEKKIVPTKEIDEFWHTHILDTHKYIDDCQLLFGEYLHHFPYFGERGANDENNLKASFLETLALFELNFNETPNVKNAAVEATICGSYITSMHGKAGYDEEKRPALN